MKGQEFFAKFKRAGKLSREEKTYFDKLKKQKLQLEEDLEAAGIDYIDQLQQAINGQ